MLFVASCTTDPPVQESEQPPLAQAEAEPYFYQPPPDSATPFATARLKHEDLAEAFMNRFRAISQGSVLVMQQEKMVLQELAPTDTSRFLCIDPLFPGYVGTLLGRLYRQQTGVPYAAIPMEEVYPAGSSAGSLQAGRLGNAVATGHRTQAYQQLISRVEAQTADSYGMAAEMLVFEPLQIDAYQLQESQLCLPPQAVLQLSSLWLRKGRWGNEQFLPEMLVNRVLAPAYASRHGQESFGWYYYRLRAKGRKQPLLYWQGEGSHVFLLPELEAVILIRAQEPIQAELWDVMQQYLIPALFP